MQLELQALLVQRALTAWLLVRLARQAQLAPPARTEQQVLQGQQELQVQRVLIAQLLVRLVLLE